MDQRQQPLQKIYQKKTQLEHILLRPDSYIGSIESREETVWVLSSDERSIEQKKIEYCPGLYKIFDEILVNAADNFQRDHRMTKIEVDVADDGRIRVLNDGKSIPVAIHKEHKVYVAELIFGHLLTSSNYEDDVKKIVGGRNGYGAKLANIFSRRFEVRTGDSSNRKQLTISWTNNMTEMQGPVIEPYNGADFTSVEFYPDFKRFGMKALSEDMMQLLKKRVYDMAGILKVKVFLNGKEIKLRSFSQYVDMYLGEATNQKIAESEARWKVVLVPQSDGQFQQVSFVNSICTYKGGSHVNYIMDQVVAAVLAALKKKHKDMEVKPAQVRSFFFLFVNCSIENPAFDAQTKENMTTKVANFGSEFVVTERMVKEILKSNVVDRIVSMVRAREHQKLSKQLKKKKGDRLIIPKLEDANLAGKGECTLILTEGDSAKSLAMAGIQRLGRDRYGVFPLKGKLLNVNEMTPKQMMENEELKSLIRIIGLELGKEYTTVEVLRYTSVMIMADQDNDGSHIKGLILNFFHSYWPSLCKIAGFLKEFITPIVRCRKGQRTLDFFSLPDYENWKASGEPGWKVKYYKGLGTSTSREAEEYFSNLPKHEITFQFRSAEDSAALEMAFNKKNSDVRKNWLSTYDPKVSVDYNHKRLTIRDFVHQELIHFSNADNVRSIPSLVDGLKPSQRKILYSCFKRNLRSEIKVAQLAGYVSEHSSYHHGEQALCMTIISMAQNFVGSNNLNLLLPIGQFGTRAMGGKDAASARYIYTNLNPLTRLLFNQADDHIVEYQQDEGLGIEPKYYFPILPLVLINGAEGIGTGWSTCIHPFKVSDVISMVRSLIKGKFEPSVIGWEDFKGTIEESNKGGYVMRGRYTVDDHTVAITELPVKKWTRDYKTFLQEKLQTSENKDTAELEELRQYHLQNNIEFVLTYLEGKLPRGDLEKELKLVANLQNSNMVLFNSNTEIKKYEGIAAILQEFYDVRLEAYKKRKEYLISKTERELQIVQMKAMFIRDVMSGKFRLEGSREQWVNKLAQMRFLRYSELTTVRSTKNSLQESDDSDKKDYDYIINMPIWSFTDEKVAELSELEARLQNQLQKYQDSTQIGMWLEDIDAFEDAWNELKQSHNTASPAKRNGKAHNGAQGKKPAGQPQTKKRQQRRKKKESDVSSEEQLELSSELSDEQPNPRKKRFVEQQNKQIKPVSTETIPTKTKAQRETSKKGVVEEEEAEPARRKLRQRKNSDDECFIIEEIEATEKQAAPPTTKKERLAKKVAQKIEEKRAGEPTRRLKLSKEGEQIMEIPKPLQKEPEKPASFNPIREAQSLLGKYLVRGTKPADVSQPSLELTLAERLMLKLQQNQSSFEESVARERQSSEKKPPVPIEADNEDLF